MAKELDRLRALVVADPELQQRLLATAGRREFIEETVRLAAERGLEIEAAELHDTLAERRRAWYSTWI